MEIRYPIGVRPLEDYRLFITFDNGEERIFDVKPYLSDVFFAPLKNISVFNTVKINPLSVEWMNDIDIAPEELYLDSIAVGTG
jgi:hypothetical protein